MIIDWVKYIANLLPISIRQPKIVELIRVLLSPSVELADELNSTIDHLRLFASCTTQVCWLQHILRSELGDESITITEGDGLPTDFIVTCNNWILETKLKGLLNRFKMAGKSYEFNFTDIDYSVQWSAPVCEKVEPIFSVQWSSPVCEVLFDLLAEEYTLIIYKNGEGIPGVIPDGITCVPSSPNAGGTNITLSAADGPGETFVKWLIHDGEVVTENTNRTFVLVMEYHDQIVDAIYE